MMKKNWLKLLTEQEALHDAELKKWQNFVKVAVNSLQNFKEIYSKFNSDPEIIDERINDDF